jgi:ABC-type nitrate/sulfonate/bicarbonate transport system permease component
LIVPYALPYIFIGLKFAVGAAFLGALVSEWAGAQKGIGTLLLYEMFAGRRRASGRQCSSSVPRPVRSSP